tara:strand:+ start:42 stop:266 length:225 start_codon:yes stop_codon:yes gene_type:complete
MAGSEPWRAQAKKEMKAWTASRKRLDDLADECEAMQDEWKIVDIVDSEALLDIDSSTHVTLRKDGYACILRGED